MKIMKIISISIQSIFKNKLRAFLIILAITVGIATLTVIISLTQGSNKRIMKRIQNFGHDAIMVHSGGGKMRGPSTVEQANFTKKDILDMENIEGVKFVSPFQLEIDMPIKYDNKFIDSWVMGVKPNWEEAWKRGVSKGRFISYSDNEQLLKVCAIGETVAQELFGESDPIGENILIKNISFRVIGILKKAGQSPMGTDFDNLILIPFTTASRRLMNQPLYSSMSRVIIDNPQKAKAIANEIREVLRQNHHLAATEDDDFRITTAQQVIKMIKSTSKTLGIFLWLIAIISPLVGGIVLMNIMLMAVSERKREIGLRRAMGAKKKHIIFQFLTESLILTFLGGILGVSAGVIIVIFMSFLGKPMSVSWLPFVMAFLFSTLIGLFFGVYPARQAANLDPASILSQS